MQQFHVQESRGNQTDTDCACLTFNSERLPLTRIKNPAKSHKLGVSVFILHNDKEQTQSGEQERCRSHRFRLLLNWSLRRRGIVVFEVSLPISMTESRCEFTVSFGREFTTFSRNSMASRVLVAFSQCFTATREFTARLCHGLLVTSNANATPVSRQPVNASVHVLAVGDCSHIPNETHLTLALCSLIPIIIADHTGTSPVSCRA